MVAALVLLWCGVMAGPGRTDSVVTLPAPDTAGRVTVEQALWHRRSVRAYADEPLTLSEVGQVLWAAQGLSCGQRGRTAPSAGATYPMELYLAAGKVKGIEAGLYHYLLDRHALRLVKRVDLRQSIAGAAWGQACIQTAPAVLVLGATYGRTTGVYGDRGVRYVDMEAGHVGQNVHLQCEALGLGTVMIGAFQDARVKKLLGMKEEPLYIMPVGKKKE